MSSKKRKLDQLDVSREFALKEEESSEPSFRIAINSGDPDASTYISDFDPRLNLKYTVHLDGNKEIWKQLRGYKTFETSNPKLAIPIRSFIYVRGVVSAPRNVKSRRREVAVLSDEEIEYETWVAQVLECRAANGQNVFLRVVWLYWPDDLQGYGGRKDHHGELEVIPSNHMQIINATTVSGLVHVERWDDMREANHTAKSDYLPWRQTLNVHSAKRKLALKPKPAAHCICHKPANPSRFLFRCGSCERWMHEECILGNAVKEAPNTVRQQNSRDKTSDEAKQNSSGKTPGSQELPPPVHEAKVTGSDSMQVEHRHSFLSRVIDKVMSNRNSPAKPVDGDLPSINLRSGGQSTSKTGKLALDEPLPSPSQEDIALGLGGESFQANVKESSSEHPHPTITVSGHKEYGPDVEWEEPIHCLFKDCGATVL